jgi:hypothetical protein
MGHARRAVQILVPAYWLVGTLDVGAALWLGDRLPAGLVAWQAAQSALPVTDADRMEQAWMLALLVALIAGSLGLLQQRAWGRWLFLRRTWRCSCPTRCWKPWFTPGSVVCSPTCPW